MVAVVVVRGQGDLVQVVRTADAVGGLADFLDGGQEQPDQDADDGDDDQQLDQREPTRPAPNGFHERT